MPGYFRVLAWALSCILIFFFQPAVCAADTELTEAIKHLCVEVVGGKDPDRERIVPILKFVRANRTASMSFEKYEGAPGAYQGFPIRLPLQRLLRYLYNPEIPQEVIKPFSIRSSIWTTPGAAAGQRRLWSDPWPPEAFVLRGEQYDRTTPDPSTGGCYAMRLKRAIVWLPEEKTVISVSVQDGPSEVGTKGYILGPDADALYVYSDETGLTASGLGWVSSRIQTNVSIGIYMEEGNEVASAVLQWMRAGWSGISVVSDRHIRDSLTRYRERMVSVLHDPSLPDPKEFERLFREVSALDMEQLRKVTDPVFHEFRERAGKNDSIMNLIHSQRDQASRDELVSMGVRRAASRKAGHEAVQGAMLPRE